MGKYMRIGNMQINTKDLSFEYEGKHYSKEEAESLPMKTITITLEHKEWKNLCKYVMLGIWYMNEEIKEVSDITTNMRAMLLYSRVRMCKELRERILENKDEESSVTLSLTEWATLRDCIWQGTSWISEHVRKPSKRKYSEKVGLEYHNMIMREERKAYKDMTIEEELSYLYNHAINFV